jgi:hypothetical protein
MGEVEVAPGIEAVRVMSGDHGVEVLREILAALGAEGQLISPLDPIST